MDNFGFVELMNKLGIERRLLTAGDNKGLFDPFLPEDAGQKAHLQQMLNEVHQHFIDAVKQGRGERLSQQADLFSGLIWTGEKAIELGLVDEFGTTKYGDANFNKLMRKRGINRLMLHASRLELPHSRFSMEIVINAKSPDLFKRLIESHA